MQNTCAVIDIGSNSIRLSVYSYADGFLTLKHQIKAVARLSNHLDSSNQLDNKGLDKLKQIMKIFKESLLSLQVHKHIAFATAAIRFATNQEEIIKEIELHTGISIKVLSSYEEASYGFLGMIGSTYLHEGLTIDIGGGSTEITYFNNRKLIEYHSFPFGALTLKKQFVSAAQPTANEIGLLNQFIEKQLQSLNWLRNKKLPILAIGGSARTLAKIDRALKKYPLSGLHHYELRRADIHNVRHMLYSLSSSELLDVKGLSKERNEIILPAIEVFKTLCDVSHADRFIISEKGLREGIALEYFHANEKADVASNKPLFTLAHEWTPDWDDVEYVKRITLKLLSDCSSHLVSLIDPAGIKSVERILPFMDIGKLFQTDNNHVLTFHLISQRSIEGISHKERVFLALLASYKTKSSLKQLIKPYKRWFTPHEAEKICLLGTFVKLVQSLNYTKRRIVSEIKVHHTRSMLKLNILCTNDWELEKTKAEKYVKELEKLLNKQVILQFSFAIHGC